jgi:hypothetical protein
MPDGKTTLAKRFSFDVKSFNDSPVELNEDFMLEQALQQADADLVHYLDKERKDHGELSDTLTLIKLSDLKLLVHLWATGSSKHLVEVYQKTECDLLRDALRPILNLPTIVAQEMF